MYKLIHHNSVIGYSKLESGDAPMGVVFGEFIPLEDINTFDYFKSLPNQGEEFSREINENDGLLLMGLNNEFKVINENEVEISGQHLTIEGMQSDFFQLSILGISYPFYEEEFPQQCKDYEEMYSSSESDNIEINHGKKPWWKLW